MSWFNRNKVKEQQHLKPLGNEILLVIGELSDQDIVAARNVLGEGERRMPAEDRDRYWRHEANPSIGRISTKQFVEFKHRLASHKKYHVDDHELTSGWNMFAGSKYATWNINELIGFPVNGGIYFVVMTPETAAMTLETFDAGDYSVDHPFTSMELAFMLRHLYRGGYYGGAAIVDHGTATYTELRDESELRQLTSS